MKNPTAIITIDDAVYDLIHHSEVPAKAQAESLGVSYSRLVNSCLESSETAHHHTRWIVPQTLRAGNFVLMDFLERALGRVAVCVPRPAMPKKTDAQSLVNEVVVAAQELGEMAAAVRESLADEKMSPMEAAKCRKETWDRVSQAVKIYHQIEQLTNRD